LLKRNIYLIQGNVYVTNNAVLTIEPGTVIIGDFETKGTLVITKSFNNSRWFRNRSIVFFK
jgi:hypothetical protein